MTFGTDAGANESSDDHVAWGWKANGGTTSSNSTGDITTTVQTDSTSGFSVITYTGNNTDDQTIGHGLGAVPGFSMFKSRDGAVAGTGNWVIQHQSLSGTEYLFMTTAAKSSTNNNFKSTILFFPFSVLGGKNSKLVFMELSHDKNQISTCRFQI